MGQYGRIGLTVAGYVLGTAFLGPIGGVLGGMLGAWGGRQLFPMKSPGISTPSGASARQTIVDGFSQTSLSTQVPVPIVFGKTMVPGNFLSAILLGEGNKRLVATIGLGEGPIDLLQTFIDGQDFTTLVNYSASRSDDKSWIEFYNDGQASTISIKNTGKKKIGGSAYQGQTVVSYTIQIMGVDTGNEIRFYLQHWSPKSGSSQTWNIKGQEEDHADPVTLVNDSGYFRKYVEYEVPDDKGGSSTKKEYVEGMTQTTYSVSLPYAGKWTFTLEVSQATNNGYVVFDMVQVLQDAGETVTYSYHKTAYVLVNLVKTAAISSGLRFNFLVNGLSDNPAVALRTVLEDPNFGLGIANEIDGDSFDAAANWCTTKGYKINIAFLDIDYGQAIELIRNAGRLLLIRTGGIYKCIPEEDSAPVAAFDEAANILPGSLEWGFLGEEAKFNRLRVKYADEEEDYTLQDIILDDIAQIEADGYVREVTYDLSAVTSMLVAAELGNTFFKKSKYIDIWLKFSIGLQDALVEIGDIIEVTSSSLGFSNKPFRILKIDENEKFGYDLYVIEHYAEIYNPDVSFTDWHPEPFEPPDPGVSGPPYVYIDSFSQEIIPVLNSYQLKVTVNYTVPTDDEKFDHVEVWVRPGYSSNWSLVGEDSNGNIEYIVPEPYVDYEYKLVTVSPDGEKTDFNLSPTQYHYPTSGPYYYPGWGGGRWGIQPWGI
jgi:hypothetical protein